MTMQTGQPCRIHILPDLLINKIAAGEVVERPSSAVKELVENAIDAGATQVSVTIEDGGRELIRVTDNGCGMNEEELRLAVMPHATSKVASEDDLFTIATMGFRGEALASIAAVSKLRIVSRPTGAISGNEVQMAGDQFEAALAAGCREGTTVEVRDLFFNVPARRKFLKGASTESGHISEQFARIALAHPHVDLKLTTNGRVKQDLPACESRLARIAKFYGPELASALLHVKRDERGLKIDAYAGPPAQSRANARWQYVFVNGRYIRDRFILHAIKEAYRGLMEPHRHAVIFLFIEIDPHEVDVNVHPTKIEVRWADSNMVHSQVLSALRETFQRADLSPALSTDRANANVDPAEQDRLRREMAEQLKAIAPINPGAPGSENRPRYEGSGESRMAGFSGGSFGEPRSEPSGIRGDVADVLGALYKPPVADQDDGDSLGFSGRAGGEGADRLPPDRPRAVQMHNLYLVVESEEGIVIIDQHALHERVMYEHLKERITVGPLEGQRLLLPETVHVTPKQASHLDANSALLSRLGIEVGAFGPDAVAVQSFPALLKDTDVPSFMRDLLDLLESQPANGDDEPGQVATAEVVIHKVLDMMACKAAVKAGDVLTPEEIEALLAKRHLIDKSTSCPHGRPTMLRLTKADLNRQFHRT